MRRICLLLLILSLASLVPATHGTSYAQGEVEITDVSPVQVLEGFPLVAGKATVVRVAIAAERAAAGTLVVRFDGREYEQEVALKAGRQWVDVPVNPPGRPGPLTVTAEFRGRVNAAAEVETFVVTPTRKLKLFYLPTDWTPEQRRRFDFDKVIPRFVELQTEFLRAVYPLPESDVEAKFAPVPHMVAAHEKALIDANGTTDSRALSTLYGTVYLAARRQAPDADLIVAILPPDWFGTYLDEPGTLGLQFKLVSGLVLAQIGIRGEIDFEADKPIVASHEIGHVYNLDDEYDFSQSPPKRGDRIDVPGYWVIRREVKEDSETTPVFNFMSAAGLPDYWVRAGVYSTLLTTFTDWDGKSGLREVVADERTTGRDLRAAEVDITMAKDLDREYGPVNPTTTYGPNDPFRASIVLTNVPDGTRVTARWYFGSVLLREGGTTARGNAQYRVVGAGLSSEAPWERGDYRLEIYLDRELKATAKFSVR